MNQFVRRLLKAMIISEAVMIPPGLIIAGFADGASGIAGAAVGFAVAAVHSVALVLVLKWALSKPPTMLPTLLMGSYFVRLLALVGILFGLTFVKALNMVAMLIAFLVVYLFHTGLEFYYAWRTMGVSTKK
jgi:hypothetical protein